MSRAARIPDDLGRQSCHKGVPKTQDFAQLMRRAPKAPKAVLAREQASNGGCWEEPGPRVRLCIGFTMLARPSHIARAGDGNPLPAAVPGVGTATMSVGANGSRFLPANTMGSLRLPRGCP